MCPGLFHGVQAGIVYIWTNRILKQSYEGGELLYGLIIPGPVPAVK